MSVLRREPGAVHSRAAGGCGLAGFRPAAIFPLPTAVLLAAGLLGAGSGPAAAQAPPPPVRDFEIVDVGIPELQAALAAGRVTSVQLVDAYLARIEAYDHAGPELNSILRLNPDARREAAERDRERAEGRVRGPLHGIPVLLKDNYDVAGLPTSAGTLALAGLVPPDDAWQVRRLREAGAVILGKTNLHELAAGITTVSSLGGQTRNPYDPARNPGGSSGGTGAAVAASFAAVGWGTDTCGSIRIPSALNDLVGLRPTKGLSSIDGIVPLSHSQDVAGPLARTVTDLAIALDATVGPDPADPATRALEGRSLPRFVESLDPGALHGARIGVLEPWVKGSDVDREVSRIVRAALDEMEEEGAAIVPVPLPGLDSLLAGTSLIGDEFAFDLADYLAATPGAPVHSLGEILERGLAHEEVAPTLRLWDRTGERETPSYREHRARQTALRTALERTLSEQNLDALAYPTMRQQAALIGEPARGSSCSVSAHSGLPALTIPAGFTRDEVMPVGLELLGPAFSDAHLVALAYAFEESTDHRRPPLRTPRLAEGRVPPARIFAATPDPDADSSRATTDGTDSTSPPDSTGSPAADGHAARSVGDGRLTATFHLDVPAGTLGYRAAASGIPANEVHAIVLERREGRRPRAVVARLSGPGHSAADGTLHLTAPLLRDLLAGDLDVALYTRDRPLGATLLRVDPSVTR